MERSAGHAHQAALETIVPARLDRLPFGLFHIHVIIALGITWILDGLEVTLVGSMAGALKASPVLHLTDQDIGFAGSAYLAGAVLGSLIGRSCQMEASNLLFTVEI